MTRQGAGVTALAGLRLFVMGAIAIAAVAIGGRFLQWPLLTATLGPTVYVFVAHPESETARVRNAVLGHLCAVGAGVAMLAAFGLWHHPATAVEGHSDLRQAGAAALAVGITLLALHVTRSHHAPAAATALLVATGLARPGKPFFGLLIGLGAVILVVPLVARLPLGRDLAARADP